MALDTDKDIGYGTPILGHNGIRGPQKVPPGTTSRWRRNEKGHPIVCPYARNYKKNPKVLTVTDLALGGINFRGQAAQRWKELSGQEAPENGDSSKWKMSGAELDYYDYY
uniref:Uncharacterized protein n=1 Tax=Romanomermis culicivorax TaxID=13658 RepID=A0A915K5T5_ROMCU